MINSIQQLIQPKYQFPSMVYLNAVQLPSKIFIFNLFLWVADRLIHTRIFCAAQIEYKFLISVNIVQNFATELNEFAKKFCEGKLR